jgi:hypothetical protein
VIEPGSAVEEASYIIFHDDDTPKNYYAKDGNTGSIVKNSDNASEVINWAISQLDKGKVFIKAGTYDMTASIVLKDFVDIVGEGYYSTILSMATNNIPMIISPKNATGHPKAVMSSIRDMVLFGNKSYYSSTYGIEAIIYKASIERVLIRDFGIAGIRFFGIGENWYGERTYEVKLLNSIISNNKQAQIIWDEYSSDNFIDNIMIYCGVDAGYGIVYNGGGGDMYSNVHINRCKNSVYFIWSSGVMFNQCYFDGDSDQYSVTEEHVLIEPDVGKTVGVLNFLGCNFLSNHKTGDTYSVIKLNATNGRIGYVKIHESRFTYGGSKKPKYIYEEVNGENIFNVSLIDNILIQDTYTAASPFKIESNSTIVRDNIGYPSVYSEASYVIFTDGSKIYAQNGDTGTVEFSDKNASKVIQSAIDSTMSSPTFFDRGGQIFIKGGVYNLTAPLKIIGQVNKGIEFIGEGKDATWFTSAENINMIELSKAPFVRLAHFSMRFTGNGPVKSAIRGLSVGGLIGDLDSSIYSGTIEDIKIETLQQNSDFALYLTNPFYSKLDNLRIGANKCIKLEANSTALLFGNTALGRMLLVPQGPNSIGLELSALNPPYGTHVYTNRTLWLINNYAQLQIFTLNPSLGSKGVILRGVELANLDALEIEGPEIGVEISNQSFGNRIKLQYMGGVSKTQFLVDSTSKNNVITSLSLADVPMPGVVFLNDSNRDALAPTQILNTMIEGGNWSSTPIIKTSATVFKNFRGYLGVSENRDNASGNSPIIIPNTTHMFVMEPSSIIATPKSGLFNVRAYWNDGDKTIRIEHDAGTSAEVYWHAEV